MRWSYRHFYTESNAVHQWQQVLSPYGEHLDKPQLCEFTRFHRQEAVLLCVCASSFGTREPASTSAHGPSSFGTPRGRLVLEQLRRDSGHEHRVV